MAGLTFEQMQKMGATPVQPKQPVQPMPGKGLTLAELQAQGATPVATSTPAVKPKVLPTSNTAAAIKITNPASENAATLPYTGDESLLDVAGKTLVNTPKSLFNVVKGTVGAIVNPIDTAKNVTKLVKGAGAAVGEKVIENTDVGQKFLEVMNESRKRRGLNELSKDEEGKLQLIDNDELEMAKGMGEYFKERYGGAENLKRTLIEDPAGLALDASMFLSGGSTGAAKVANLTEKAGMLRTAKVLNTGSKFMGETSKFVDPLRQSAKVVKPVVTKTLNNASDFVTKSGKTLQADAMTKGFEGMNQNLKGLKNTFEEATFTLPDETNPGKFKKVTPLDTIKEYNLAPEVKGSKVNVDTAKQTIKDNMTELNNKIDTELKVSDVLVDVEGYGKKLEEAINATKKSQEVKNVLKEKLKTYIEQTKVNYPDGIPAEEINMIRKEANLDYDPTTMDFSRMKGNATRDIVYNLTDDQIIKQYLTEQRKLINAEDYLSRIENHAVKGGRLGGYFAQGTGVLIGNAIGGAPGAIAGGFTGRKTAEFLQSRQFKSLPADIKATIEKAIGKELVAPTGSEMKTIIKKKVDEVKDMPNKQGGFVKNPLNGDKKILPVAKTTDEFYNKLSQPRKEIYDKFKEETGQSITQAKINLDSMNFRDEMRKAGSEGVIPKSAEKYSYTPEQIKMIEDFQEKAKTSPYLFHTSKVDNLDSIMEKGLTIGNKPRFEGVSAGDKLYLGANESMAKYYGGDTDVVFRVKKDFKVDDLEVDPLVGQGSYMTKNSIPANALQIKVGKKWVDLSEANKQSVIDAMTKKK